MSAVPKAFIAHDIDRRVRLRVPSRRGDASFFSNVRDRLSRCLDVDRVESNPLTGSVLIFHRGKLDTIENYSKSHQLFEIVHRRTDNRVRTRPVASELFSALNAIDESMHATTMGNLDLPTTAALGIAGLSVIQMFRKEWLPPAWTLLGDAFLILMNNQKRGERAGTMLKRRA